MPFLTTFTGDELDKLRTPEYAGEVRLFIMPAPVVFKARVLEAPTILPSFGFVNFTSVTIGAYTDVKESMTVYFSETDDIKAAYFTARIRLDAAAASIYIEETSQPISTDDYIFVTEDYRIAEKNLYSNFGTLQFDFGIAFRQLPPIGQYFESAYAAEVSSGSASFELDGTAYAPTSGDSIDTYEWDVEDGSIDVGTDSDPVITASFEQGARWVKLTITTTLGLVTKIKIPAIVNGPDFPALNTVENISVECQDGSWNASFTAFDGIEDILPKSLVIIYDAKEYYGGEEGSIGSNVHFVGRMRAESTPTRGDDTHGMLSESRIQCEGPASQLAHTRLQSLTMRNVESPSVIGEVKDWTPWRGICLILREFSTYAELHSIDFEDFTDALESLGSAVQGDIYSAINSLAQSIPAVIDYTPQGHCQVVTHACLTSTASSAGINFTPRDSLDTIATWTDGSTGTIADVLEFDPNYDPIDPVGKLNASGAIYSTANAQQTAVMALAPGMAFGSGASEDSLVEQILPANITKAAANIEIRRRGGESYALRNAKERLNVVFPDGYHFLVPSRNQWHKFVIADNARGIVYTAATRWLLESISVAYAPDGTRDVRGVILKETKGFLALAVDPPANGEVEAPPVFVEDNFAYPGLPEPPPWIDDAAIDDEVQPGDETTRRDGNFVIVGGESEAFLSKLFILGGLNPIWNEVTPALDDNEIMVGGVLNQMPGTKAAYILTNKDEQSRVHRTEDVAASDPEWAPGEWIDGLFDTIRHSVNTIAVKASDIEFTTDLGLVVPGNHDFTLSDHNWYEKGAEAQDIGLAHITNPRGGLYSAGVGWEGTLYTDGGGRTSDSAVLKAVFDGTYTFTSAQIYYTVYGAGGDLTTHAIVWQKPDDTWTQSNNNAVRAPGNYNIGFNLIGQQMKAVVIGVIGTPGTATDVRITRIELVSPTLVSGGGGSSLTENKVVVRFSDDEGDTFGDEIIVGDAAASGGFDMDRPGAVTLAGVEDKVRIATTIEGAYADETNGGISGAVAVSTILPYYILGSTSTKNYPDTSPEYVLAADTLVSSASLWWVRSAGKQDITPDISGTKALGIGANLVSTIYGTKIAAVMTVSGNRYLFICTNLSVGGTPTWTYVAVGSSCAFIRVRRGGTQQLYVVDGTVVKYTGVFTTTLISKTTPATETLTWMDVLG